MIRIFLSAILALLLALGWSLWRAEVHKGNAEAAEAIAEQVQGQLKAEQDARETEQRQAGALAAIGDTHEQDRTRAEAIPAAVVADLRAGNVSLRKEWAGCETRLLSEAVASTIERDALAQRREQLAGEIVRIGRDADDHVRACQAVVKADREQ